MRCSLCNHTNNPELEHNIGDYVHGLTFSEDPSNPLFMVCDECKYSIDDALSEFEEDEELDLYEED